jgi:hypothetical protein
MDAVQVMLTILADRTERRADLHREPGLRSAPRLRGFWRGELG